jgi:SHS2 domain-containing protein
MYETFAHTADIGLRVSAADLLTLLQEAGHGLLALLVENPASVQPQQSVLIEIPYSGDNSYLLFDWLNELLFLFEAQHLLISQFDLVLEAKKLVATVAGEPLDRSRHQTDHEVKAITYHGLTVVQVQEGWRAEVILDI